MTADSISPTIERARFESGGTCIEAEIRYRMKHVPRGTRATDLKGRPYRIEGDAEGTSYSTGEMIRLAVSEGAEVTDVIEVDLRTFRQIIQLAERLGLVQPQLTHPGVGSVISRNFPDPDDYGLAPLGS